MATARLQKEANDIARDPLDNFQVSPHVDGNVFRWKAVMFGPDGSPYAGGAFTMTINFDKEYPFKPPAGVIFETAIYHPNIDPMGRVTFNLLKGKDWNQSKTVKQFLAALLSLLTSPQLDCTPTDKESRDIAELYKTDKKKFEENAREWTRKYAS